MGVRGMVRMDVRTVRQGGGWPEVVIHIQDIGQEAFGGPLFQVELLHLVLHHYRLACDFFTRPTHSQCPWNPLQEYTTNLKTTWIGGDRTESQY